MLAFVSLRGRWRKSKLRPHVRSHLGVLFPYQCTVSFSASGSFLGRRPSRQRSEEYIRDLQSPATRLGISLPFLDYDLKSVLFSKKENDVVEKHNATDLLCLELLRCGRRMESRWGMVGQMWSGYVTQMFAALCAYLLRGYPISRIGKLLT